MVWTFIISLLFGISVLAFVFTGMSSIRRVYFFPQVGINELRGEQRFVPFRTTRQESIELFVRELILGPIHVDHLRVVPRDTRLTALETVGSTVYLDLSPEIIFRADDTPLSLKEIVTVIRKNIQFNFRDTKEVVITIGGEEPVFVQ